MSVLVSLTRVLIKPSVSFCRACSEWHLHCRHLLAFFAGGWCERDELDRFGIGNFLLAFFGVAFEEVLLNRPDDLLSAATTCFFVNWAMLRFTAFRFLITCIGVCLWAFYSSTVFGIGLVPTFEAFCCQFPLGLSG